MSRNFVSCIVPLSNNLGVDLNAYLMLERKPTRQNQKLKTLKSYVQTYRTGWKKRLELANLLYEMGFWSDAILEYEQVSKIQPQLIQPQIQWAKLLQLINRKEEAIAVYQRAREITRNEATRCHLTGCIESCQGHMQKAIAAFKLATISAPQNLAHWLALAQTQMELEQYIDALSSLDTILSHDPQHFMGLIYSHDILITLGNLPDALRYLEQAKAVAPQDIQTLKRLITHRCRMQRVFEEEGKTTKKLLQVLVKQAPRSPEVQNLWAQYDQLRGQPARAQNRLEQFTIEYPNNPQGWYYYSRFLFNIGEQNAASTAILKAYESSPQGHCDREIYQALCEILPSAENFDRFRYLIEEMLEYFPTTWSLWAIAGKSLVEHFKDIDRGCDYSLQGTILQPQLADSWYYHGRVLALAGKHQDAIEILNHGLSLVLPQFNDIKSVSARVWLGESYQFLGQDFMALQALETACEKSKALIETNPILSDYWYNRARTRLVLTVSGGSNLDSFSPIH